MLKEFIRQKASKLKGLRGDRTFSVEDAKAQLIAYKKRFDVWYQDKFTKNDGLIYLTSSEKIMLFGGKKYRVIISPSLYWVKKVQLPVKSVRDAKALAPSLFDSFLPSGESFLYEAFDTNDGHFVLIAYNPLKIMERISACEIEPTSIRAFYFAQSEFANLSRPLLLGKKIAVLSNESVVLELPQSYATNAMDRFERFYETFYFSSRKFSPELFEDLLPDKKTYLTMFVLMGLSILFLSGQYLYLNYKMTALETQTAEYLTSKKMPSTQMALTSMRSTLAKKESNQYDLRTKMRYLQDLKFEDNNSTATTPPATNSQVVLIPGSSPQDKNRILVGPMDANIDGKEFVKSLSFKDGQMELIIALKDDKRAEYVKDFLKKQFKVESITVKNKQLTAKVATW